METCRRGSREAYLAGCVLLLAGMLAPGCGCGKRESRAGAVKQVRQHRLMYSADKDERTCYIVAEVVNAGDLPVREVKVTATLRNASGKSRGVNHHFLNDLRPGEHRSLSMTVTAHGSFQHVSLSFSDPEAD